ncbi:MAG: hypothetical protein U1B83_02470, partial [Candidatus Cloacimonadaceae bacterium]|nr:hypothetical protein [Candidatus Cloacimonadaceae bacterium]
ASSTLELAPSALVEWLKAAKKLIDIFAGYIMFGLVSVCVKLSLQGELDVKLFSKDISKWNRA